MLLFSSPIKFFENCSYFHINFLYLPILFHDGSSVEKVCRVLHIPYLSTFDHIYVSVTIEKEVCISIARMQLNHSIWYRHN